MVGVQPTPRPPPSGKKTAIRRPPVERLASLKRPIPVPIRRPQSIHPQSQAQHQSLRPQIKPIAPPKPATCPNPNCSAPNIVEDDGQKVCSGCGTVVGQANIVSEVTFGESSSGAAVVQGTFVAADQSHGRSFGPGFQRGGIESREVTEQNGNRYIAQISRALNIPESASKAGSQVFKLAVGLNFIQGRRTKTVAAVALYVACRRQDGNTVMLIDFADVLMINVFKLGRAYKALLDELRLGGNHFIMNPIDPESLIYRFSKQLEFGPSMMQVASEAVRIVQRMNRDWMITGRRPAGICGAALILAARMNNFRRTVREVVYVVKVTELTIVQRLNEFKATESGGLTVDEFRSVQLENCHDPPSFTRSKAPKVPRKKRALPETAAELENDSDDTSDDAQSVEPPQKVRRVDADGFTIPAIPIDPALLRTSAAKNAADALISIHKPQKISGINPPEKTASSNSLENESPQRGRPKGSKNSAIPEPTEAELAFESALEDEMTALLSSNSDMVATAARPAPPASESSSSVDIKSPLTPDEIPVTTTPRIREPVSTDPEIDPTEFDSDPEVRYCLLSPAEVEIKERIWVHENKDYLRTQQAKALRKALAEASADPSKKGIQRPRKRRKGRIGDVGYLSNEKNADGESVGGSRASTPAEATRLMLERRGFSKKINYQLLEKMYGDDETNAGKDMNVLVKRRESEDDGSLRRSRSRSVSVSRSVRHSSVVSERGLYGGRTSGNKPKMPKGSRSLAPTLSKPVTSAPVHKPQTNVPPVATAPDTTKITIEQPPQPPPPQEEVSPVSTNPEEEILGFIAGDDNEGKPEERDYDEDEDEDEGEDEDTYNDDGIDAAFAGNYYDEGSDGGYEDDDYY
ncbi:transcription factor TFIIIB subunit brf1 [Myotisia sp. PD_48]|nr:transcription factor TFIIIB subunit brf1 [Myotisia sp. PD_48]